MTDESKKVTKRATPVKGKRSPNYPAINLQKAISMVSNLYEQYQRHEVPAALGMKAMGYSITSGTAQSLLASLSYYGLVDVERGPLETKKMNITTKGFTILKSPNLNEKNKAIKDAALSPAIFKKLYSQFSQHFPQDSLLAWELESAYSFNPKTIPDFISIFKQTMDYAKIYESGIIQEENEEVESPAIDEKEDNIMHNIQESQKTSTLHLKSDSKSSYMPQAPVGVQAEKEIANYPIKGGTIRLLASGPVTQKAIDKLIALLKISKEDFPEDDQTIMSEDELEQPE